MIFFLIGLYREDLAVSGQQVSFVPIPVVDYTERIWRYQDNNMVVPSSADCDYTERIWRYQDNTTADAVRTLKDYTERIWRYQDNRSTTNLN